jgi:hypothetical protein
MMLIIFAGFTLPLVAMGQVRILENKFRTRPTERHFGSPAERIPPLAEVVSQVSNEYPGLIVCDAGSILLHLFDNHHPGFGLESFPLRNHIRPVTRDTCGFENRFAAAFRQFRRRLYGGPECQSG